MQVKKRSPARRALFSLITILLILLVLEVIARAYYYNRLNTANVLLTKNHPLALVQLFRDLRFTAAQLFKSSRNNQNHYRVRPNVSKEENNIIARESLAANEAVYQPWVQFSFKNFNSKYVNVNNQVRKSVPEVSDTTAASYFTIFFLGGSTMYGFNVTDEETIASYFVKAYRQKYPAGKPIRVINYGTPYYFSYQELIFLTDKLYRGEIPGMVIMLDGLNDVVNISSSVLRTPFFTGYLKQLVDRDDATGPRVNFYKAPADSVNECIYRNYIDNIASAKKLTALYGVPLYCFIQPVPFFDYDNRMNDPACTHEKNSRFAYIYPKIETKATELDYLFYLGNMLKHEKGYPYVDAIHYSPAVNKAIAEKMLDSVRF